MKKHIIIAAMLVATMAVVPVAAQERQFTNGPAYSNWQQLTEQGQPAPAPWEIVSGVKYRIGDPGVQFTRFPVGGVQIILGECSRAEAARQLAVEYYVSGKFSVLLDCDAVDDNHR